jgi:hypothetical protein
MHRLNPAYSVGIYAPLFLTVSLSVAELRYDASVGDVGIANKLPQRIGARPPSCWKLADNLLHKSLLTDWKNGTCSIGNLNQHRPLVVCHFASSSWLQRLPQHQVKEEALHLINSMFPISANDGLRRRKFYISISFPRALETICVNQQVASTRDYRTNTIRLASIH